MKTGNGWFSGRHAALSPARTMLAAFVLLSILGAAAPGAGSGRGRRSGKRGQYGVRWKVIENETVDYYLPCERIEHAKRLSPKDFDRIFPWSHIKLCNIKKRSGKRHTITYSSGRGFALDGSKGNVMVEIPKHYSKRYIRDGYEYRLISAKPRSGFIVDPAFVENGRAIKKVYVGAYEAHISADGKMESVSGVYPTADKTRIEYRTFARANGAGYGMFDMRILLMIQNLFLIEHADRDSQRAIGNGWGKILQPARTHRCALAEKRVNRLVTTCPSGKTAAAMLRGLFVGCAVQITSYERPSTVYHTGRSLTRVALNSPQAGLASMYFDGDPVGTTTDMCIGGAAQKTGWADKVAGHSGHSAYNGSPPYDDYRCAVKYRHMENLWGNVWCFMDGLNLSNGRAFFCENMDDYASGVTADTYKPTAIVQLMQNDNGDVGGPREVHYLRNLGYDPRHPWLALPQDYTYQGKSSVPGASARLRNGNFGDYYYLNKKATCYVHGGGFDHYWRCGLFTLRGWATDSAKWYLYGSRLIFKPM